MASIFRQESAFMRALTWLAEVVEITILMIVTALPIVTIGASLTAGYSAAYRLRIGEGKTFSNFFRAFKANFWRATVMWLIMGPVGAAIVFLWIFVQMTPLLVIKFALSIVWLIIFYWLWALQARFDNSIGSQFKNALIFGVSKIGYTVALGLIDAAFIALVVASWLYMPQGLFLLGIFSAGLLTAAHVPVIERGLRPWLGKGRAEK